MTRIRSTSILLLALALALPAGAQEPGDGRGSLLPLAFGAGEPVSPVLEVASLLDLTAEQRDRLIDIRRRLRRLNDPFEAQLDSIRRVFGIGVEPPRRISDEYRLQLERFDRAAEPIANVIRTNNEGARLQVRAQLDSVQRARLDSIEGDSARGRGRGRGRGGS